MNLNAFNTSKWKHDVPPSFARTVLRDAGYLYRSPMLGAGATSRIYDIGQGLVARVTNNYATIRYAEWCMQQRENGADMTHLPVIHSVRPDWFYRNETMVALIVCERLERADGRSRNSRRQRPYGWWSPSRYGWEEELAKVPPSMQIALRALASWYQELHSKWEHASWDLAARNYMQRADGTLVINDPVA